MTNKQIRTLHKAYDAYLEENNDDNAGWIAELLFLEKSKEFLVEDYITQLKNHFIHLQNSELDECYELSAKIFKVINQNEAEFIKMCYKTNWFLPVMEKDILDIKTGLNTMYLNK